MGRRIFAKLALAAGLAFGLYEAADATAPAPNVTQVFNNASANPAQKAAEYRLEGLAEPQHTGKEIWRVRVGSWEMAAGGHHTFIEFSPYCTDNNVCRDKNGIYQIHGIAMDETRRNYAQLDFMKSESYTRYESGDYVLKALGVNQDYNRKFFRQEPDSYVDVFYGSKEEVLKMYLDGMKIVDMINKNDDPYILTAHNSNSAQHSVLTGIGLPTPPLYVDHKLTALGGRIWCPGIGLSLLPPDWDEKKVREQGGYANLSADDLEKAARKISGPERMFATFKPQAPKPPGA